MRLEFNYNLYPVCRIMVCFDKREKFVLKIVQIVIDLTYKPW